jgi:predicted branched-subunit amino acid permease
MKNNFLRGAIDGIPIGLGYLSVSFAFGIFAVSSGINPLHALLISMTNLTSAGQLAAVPIIASGGSFIELVLSQIIINLRYALMSVSLSQKLSPKVSLVQKFLIAFGNTDEVFATSVVQKDLTASYMFGLIFTPYIGWSFGTLLGAFLGNILPEILLSSLGIMIYGMFVAIFIPAAKKERPVLLCILISVFISLLFKFVPILNTVPKGFVIIITAIIASSLMAVFKPIKEED